MRRRKLLFLVLMLAWVTRPALSAGQAVYSHNADSNGEPSDPSTRSADPTSRPVEPALRVATLTDFNRKIYYKNKLEFSADAGWLPVNIPFVFDFVVSDKYTRNPLSYTLIPVVASLRWHLGDISGPSILRGNTDLTFSSSLTVIPRGPETRYAAFDFGVRRNFVQPNWRVAPYFEARGGVGSINAKGPKGVLYAQGQDLTFTLMIGSGLRYNLNPRYSVSAGVNYMHVSNAYLSEPKYEDFGINVYGPMVGIDIRLGNNERQTAQQREPSPF